MGWWWRGPAGAAGLRKGGRCLGMTKECMGSWRPSINMVEGVDGRMWLLSEGDDSNHETSVGVQGLACTGWVRRRSRKEQGHWLRGRGAGHDAARPWAATRFTPVSASPPRLPMPRQLRLRQSQAKGERTHETVSIPHHATPRAVGTCTDSYRGVYTTG